MPCRYRDSVYCERIPPQPVYRLPENDKKHAGEAAYRNGRSLPLLPKTTPGGTHNAFRPANSSNLPPARGTVLLRAYFLGFGASIIVIRFPSSLGIISTFAISSRSVAKRSSSISPCSLKTIERPLKKTYAFTFAPSPMKFCAWRSLEVIVVVVGLRTETYLLYRHLHGLRLQAPWPSSSAGRGTSGNRRYAPRAAPPWARFR